MTSAPVFELAELRLAQGEGRDPLGDAANSLLSGDRITLRGTVVPESLAAALFVDSLDVLRDPGHVRSRPASEWISLVTAAGFVVDTHEITPQRLGFSDWCEHGRCDEDAVELLTAHMRRMPRAAEQWLMPEWTGGDDATAVSEQERELVAFHTHVMVLTALKP